jgi:hypothetical protein
MVAAMATSRQAIKISTEAHAELRRLAARAASHGWAALGIDRDDLPTQAALLEEAIRLLSERERARSRSTKR